MQGVNGMDTMERYKIQGSIEDAIDILDSAPMHRDLIPETMIVQLTNRVPIAHLAIERGLKARIASVGGTTEPIHSRVGCQRGLLPKSVSGRSNRLMLRFFCAAPVGKQDHNGRPLGEPFGLPPQLRVTGLASVQLF